jgi:hypothetical protein
MFLATFAQVGIGTTTPTAALEVTAINEGLLIPRVALSATNVATILTPTQSELVYNTFTSASGINQVTPGFYYWDVASATWVRMVSAIDGKITTINTVFDDLPNVNPIISPKVYCSGYWDKNDFGGGFFEWIATSTKDIDGGRFFASKIITTGRWVRKTADNVNVIHYGAMPVRDFFPGNNGNYGYGGVYFRNDIPVTWNQKPLSSKFATLADAKAWYPRSVAALSDAIDAVAIQSTLEFNSECFIPEGVYILNKPLQLARHKKVHGATTTNTVLHFIDCSGFVPKVSVENNSSDQNFIYLFNSSISDLTIVGNRGANEAFDDTKCGINFPNIQTLPEANSNVTPLAEGCVFNHINISSFAGHGFKFLSHFTCAFDFVDIDNCGGHGFFIQGGNTTSMRNCYPHQVGKGNPIPYTYAGYRILGAATMIACNGNDDPNSWWGVFGMDASLGDDLTSGISSSFFMSNCNFEGTKKCLELRGTFTKLTTESCTFFPYNLEPTDAFLIWDRAYKSTIRLNNSAFFLVGSTPVEAYIKAFGNNVGSNYMIYGDYNYTNAKVKYTDAAGVNLYRPGVLFDIPGITTALPAYAVKSVAVNNFSASTIYLGNTINGTTPTAQILTGSGVPTIAATDGSIYMRTNGGVGATLFVRENGAWVAK